MARALHDRLRTGELDLRAKSLGHQIIRAADEQESELRLAERVVELGVAASPDIDVEGVLRLLVPLEVEGVVASKVANADVIAFPRLSSFFARQNSSP